MNAAIEIANLGFGYKGQPSPIIQSLHLLINKGTRFGIFGPNGAGKTTLMNLMTGLLTQYSGSVKMLGYEMKEHKKKVNALLGFVPQDFSFYNELSPAENMAFFGAWAGLNKKQIHEKTDEILEQPDVDPARGSLPRWDDVREGR